MHNQIFITLTFISISLAVCFQSDNNHELIGDWFLKDRKWSADYHLRICEDNKVLFKQETYKSPCIYTFDGNLNRDTIFYSTKLTCKNITTKIQEHKWTHLDTFLILEKSKAQLKIFNTQNQETRTYIKQK